MSNSSKRAFPLFATALVGSCLIMNSAAALTFKKGESKSFDTNNEASSKAPKVRAISGVEIEAGGASLNYPPSFPSIVKNRYLFGFFWSQQDFNQDGHLDFLYTGTMRPTNENSTGKTTGGACGGDACEGDMPGPSLFLNDGTDNYVLSDELIIDRREVPGQSLSRRNLIADFNGDSRLDFFIADHAVGTHNGIRDSYFLSQPDGTWVESSKSHLSDSDFIIFDHGGAVGDIDNDGDIDIVLTDLNRQLICWFNQGDGYLKKRRCGRGQWAAIELADMDGDGDLDLVAGGDDFEWEQARILINDGKGSFKKKTKLPINRSQPHIPELSIWDLDGDGDQDIVLSRVGTLYVGTTVEILENKGNLNFSSLIIPIVEAPADYVPKHEGNEWNNFISDIIFDDVDTDGDPDVLLVGHGSNKNGHRVQASILLNEGSMEFRHIENGAAENPIKILADTKFVASSFEANWLASLSLRYLAQPYAGFFPLEEPIYLSSIDANIVAAKDINLSEDNVVFKVVIEAQEGAFVASVCSNYWKKFDFLGTMVGFDTQTGFGGSDDLRKLGTQSCANERGFRGGWEVEPTEKNRRVKALLDDLGKQSRLLIKALPILTDSQVDSIEDRWF